MAFFLPRPLILSRRAFVHCVEPFGPFRTRARVSRRLLFMLPVELRRLGSVSPPPFLSTLYGEDGPPSPLPRPRFFFPWSLVGVPSLSVPLLPSPPVPSGPSGEVREEGQDPAQPMWTRMERSNLKYKIHVPT